MASNKPENIDSSVYRPGRVKRAFYVGPPDKVARTEILQIHLNDGRHYDNSVKLEELADKTEWFQSAGLAEIVNDAAGMAVRQDININQTLLLEALKKNDNFAAKVNPELDAKYRRFAKEGFHIVSDVSDHKREEIKQHKPKKIKPASKKTELQPKPSNKPINTKRKKIITYALSGVGLAGLSVGLTLLAINPIIGGIVAGVSLIPLAWGLFRLLRK